MVVCTAKPGGSVLVMAKAPLPGTVKTRLHPRLGPGGGAALQSALIRNVIRLAISPAGSIFIAFDPPAERGMLRALAPGEVRLIPQRPAHLGDRLVAAVQAVVAHVGAGPVGVAGVDAPTLTPQLLDAAFAAINQSADGPDAVLGPALDGGYYLIGLRCPHVELFDIDPQRWGGSRVLAATLRLADRVRPAHVAATGPARSGHPDDARVLLTDRQLPASLAALLTPTGTSR